MTKVVSYLWYISGKGSIKRCSYKCACLRGPHLRCSPGTGCRVAVMSRCSYKCECCIEGSSLEVQPWHRMRCGGDVKTSDGAELRLDAAPGRLVHLARPLPHDFYWQGALVMLPQHLGGRQAGGRRAGKAAMPIGRREADRSSVSAEQKAACLCAGQRSPSPPPLCAP